MALALAQLRAEMTKAASQFADYNFRTYFVNWVTDKCDAVQAQGPTAVANFEATEGPNELARLRRMATVNAMFAESHVVVEDQGKH